MATRIVDSRAVDVSIEDLARVITKDLVGHTVVGEMELFQLTKMSLQNKGYKFNPIEICDALEFLNRRNLLISMGFYIEHKDRLKFGMKYKFGVRSPIL